eukprot:CAMPEP_0182449406 /NCGR_PEP_ID=MMETSP1172-20130603/34143_1 /TAXON_ID=708627 /ORGANISM="Timspurckia oligopyrenoides, Strain CCMP3278" /LENGTH=107 /DNA_ID=CAMNT_0024646677 /DNA_START=241 /DNA_END=564 /DNA_ORIENTATION=+
MNDHEVDLGVVGKSECVKDGEIFVDSEHKKNVLRVCKRCRLQFLDPIQRHECNYHPGDYLGAENSKFLGVQSGSMNSGTSYFFDCCGNPNPYSIGCTLGSHSTFDED